MPAPSVRDLLPEELPSILPFVAQHNPKLDPAELARRLEVMRTKDYRCVGAFLEGRMVGIAGYWLGCRFYCGEFMDVDNVFVLPEVRSAGIGAAMMDFLETKASDLGCRVVVLDSYSTYARAHKFYFRRDYEILGFHFSKPIPPRTER